MPLGVRNHPIRRQEDEDGELLEDEDDATRFKIGRAGDHLMVPFQCELCHFRNVMKRDPDKLNVKDKEILDFMRRANLDAFWSRETSTVKSNLKEGMRVERTAFRLGMPSITPPMGPFPLEDVQGMSAAIAVLDRSLDKGVYEDTVQWDTFRRSMSAITNISQAAVGGLQNSIGAYERKRMWISDSATHQFWFSRFMTGVHKRVGQIRKPDKEVSIDVIHAADRLLNIEWENARKPEEKKRIAEMGTWFIGGFCTGLRGEEKLLIELAGTAKSLEHMNDAKNAHFVFVVSGRTKANQLTGAKFGVPCAPVTEGTHLRPGRWIKRLVECIHGTGRRSGRLFSRKLVKPKLMEFENDFFLLLEKIQATTDLFPDEFVIRDECGIGRSLRRSVTAHARNMGVHIDLIKAINRWRQEANSTTGNPRLDMPDVYASFMAILPTTLRYSLSL
jgi:hypothetical protein